MHALVQSFRHTFSRNMNARCADTYHAGIGSSSLDLIFCRQDSCSKCVALRLVRDLARRTWEQGAAAMAGGAAGAAGVALQIWRGGDSSATAR